MSSGSLTRRAGNIPGSTARFKHKRAERDKCYKPAMRAEDKERAVAEVVARLVAGAGDAKGLDAAIADTIYCEHRRLEKERRSRERDAALKRWDERRRALLAATTNDEKKA